MSRDRPIEVTITEYLRDMDPKRWAWAWKVTSGSGVSERKFARGTEATFNEAQIAAQKVMEPFLEEDRRAEEDAALLKAAPSLLQALRKIVVEPSYTKACAIALEALTAAKL